MLQSSLSSFETAALNLSYSSHSLAPLRSNDHLLSRSNYNALQEEKQKPKFTHKRVVSNPFDVLYDPSKSPRHLSSSEERRGPTTPRVYAKNSTRKLYTPKNIYTPEQIMSPNHGNRRVLSGVPPVITMIDQSALHRSSSIVSREASLRHRHSIARRNKMINKKSLDVYSPTNDSSSIYGSEYKYKPVQKQSVGQKLKFLFQVRRKTSLKQKSAYRLLREMRDKRSNFQSKQELEDFFKNTNASQLMRELLPAKMKVFDYNNVGLLTRKPIIQKRSRHFNINENNEFTIVSPLNDRLKISAPLKDSFVKHTNTNAGHWRTSRNPEPEFSIVDSIYSRYRDSILHGNYQIPPKFNDLYPQETHNNLITLTDVENMNKKILLEVLLRRTLAAKIEFRLKRSGHPRKRKGHKKTSDSDDESYSSSDSEAKHDVRHSHIPKLIHTDSEDSPDDESLDTDDLMQQNASLFSGLLPSPQISYKSNMFGSDFKLNENFDDSDGDLSSRMVRSEMKLRRTASTNDLLNLVRHVTPTPVAQFESTVSNSPFHTANFNVKKVKRNESFSARREEELNVLERAMGRPQFNYELKPLTRSIETFSSSEESGMLSRTPPVELSRNSSLKSFKSNTGIIRRTNSLGNPNTKETTKRDSNITDTTGSSFEKLHRKSHSTSNTSIFQDLDDLSSQLSSFIKDPVKNSDPPRFVHKKVVKDNSLLDDNINLSNQSILETIKLSNSSTERINISKINESTGVLNQGPDIKSVEGSISMAGSETSTSFSQHQLNYNLSNIRGYSRGQVLRRDDSMSTRTITTFGRPELKKQ